MLDFHKFWNIHSVEKSSPHLLGDTRELSGKNSRAFPRFPAKKDPCQQLYSLVLLLTIKSWLLTLCFIPFTHRTISVLCLIQKWWKIDWKLVQKLKITNFSVKIGMKYRYFKKTLKGYLFLWSKVVLMASREPKYPFEGFKKSR